MPEGARRVDGEERERLQEELEGDWHVVVLEDPVGPDPMCLCTGEEFRIARIRGGDSLATPSTRGHLHLGAAATARLKEEHTRHFTESGAD